MIFCTSRIHNKMVVKMLFKNHITFTLKSYFGSFLTPTIIEIMANPSFSKYWHVYTT